MFEFIEEIFSIGIILLIIGAILFAIIGGLLDCFLTKVVDEYTVDCEVTQLDFGQGKSFKSYVMGVKCEEFSRTLRINSNEYAYYSVGDIVKVKVTVTKGFIFKDLNYSYRLVN